MSAWVIWGGGGRQHPGHIAAAHHKAIDDVLVLMERDLVATRAGEAGRRPVHAERGVTPYRRSAISRTSACGRCPFIGNL